MYVVEAAYYILIMLSSLIFYLIKKGSSMTRVLIIARSPLAEQELECTLQRSFDEVFCSSELMKEVENTR